MSVAAVSSNSPSSPLQPYFQQRRDDLAQLDQALRSGDLAGAQSAYNAIVSLGQSGPFANGVAFGAGYRQQDFQAIGAALQAGDGAGAMQAFQTLRATFHLPPASPSPAAASAGPDAVVTLSGQQ